MWAVFPWIFDYVIVIINELIFEHRIPKVVWIHKLKQMLMYSYQL